MKRIVFLFTILVSFGAGLPEELMPGKIETKEAGKMWGKEISFKALDIPSELRNDSVTFRPYDKVFLVNAGAGSQGYILSTQAAGRFEYFDYAIFYSMDLKVENVKVTKYRSSRGAAICSGGWLKQFKGYKGKPLKVGEDIQAISGATISANSITNDIQRCQSMMEKLMELQN